MVSELSSKNRRKKKCPQPSQSTSLPSAITFTILCPPWNHIAFPPPPESLSAFQVESDQDIFPRDHSSSQTSSSVSPSSEVPILSTIYHRHRSLQEKKRTGTKSRYVARRCVYHVERRRLPDGTNHALWHPLPISSFAMPVLSG